MSPSLMFLGFCLTGISLFQGVHTALLSCTTPGFYLSTDQNWCFALSKPYKTAPVQSVYCKLNGATLVTIESSAKQTQVATFLGDIGASGASFKFMGLTNIVGAQGDWAWYQGSDTSGYSNWDSGYPDTATSKTNCAIFQSGTPGYAWQNDYCLRTHQAVCQRAATTADIPNNSF